MDINDLKAKADELGITYPNNIKEATLQRKVDAALAESQPAPREFSDVEPAKAAANVTEADLEKIMDEFDKLRNKPENPLSYEAYMGARSAMNKVFALISKD